MLRGIVLFAAAALVTGQLTGCSPSPEEISQKELNERIEAIRDGELIRKIEEANNNSKKETDPVPPLPPSQPAVGVVGYPDAPPVSIADPCPQVAAPPAEEKSEIHAEVVRELASCIRSLATDVQALEFAQSHFVSFDRSSTGSKSFFEMTIDEIWKTLVQTPAQRVFLSHLLPKEWQEQIRSKFSDEDLAEFSRLNQRRKEAIQNLEEKLYAAMDVRKASLVVAAKNSNRYAAWLAFRGSHGDQTGSVTSKALMKALGIKFMFPVVVPGSGVPLHLLHPYGVMALIPEAGDELEPLKPEESPLYFAERELSRLSGSDVEVKATIEKYREYRDVDNPKWPEKKVLPDTNAVKVAFLDTGIDWVGFSDLGLYLSDNSSGRLPQYDYSDGDENPWGPYDGETDHGTKTAATMLTVLSRQSPEILKERKLDLAMWKLFSVRRLLVGPRADGGAVWESRMLSLQDAVIERLESLDTQTNPDIVSVSMGFSIANLLRVTQKSDLLLKAPWLWVMAAGNQGEDLSKNRRGCFADVEEKSRKRDHILCVGALVNGITTESDMIADYSNYGSEVDVYTYQSFTGLCPAGTSCSTPAITAAATTIRSKFPFLSPAEIKKAIVLASEERELKVNDPLAVYTGAPEVKRMVKVFDPSGPMMQRALQKAGLMQMEKIRLSI